MRTAADGAPREHHAPSGGVLALAAGALGVVFGDIGTSPLYTLQVGIAAQGGAQPDLADVLGVCSLIVWALTMVVTVKYLTFVMRADNQGEGGILALLALVPQTKHARIAAITVIVVAGAALLYGDGIITPAISVLSANDSLGTHRPPAGIRGGVRYKPRLIRATSPLRTSRLSSLCSCADVMDSASTSCPVRIVVRP